MKKLTLSPAVFILVIILYSTSYAQMENKNPLSLSFQSGMTIHADYLINDNYDWKGIGFNYFEGGIYFKITKNVEIGVTIGQDDFKITKSGTEISVSPQGDTSYSTFTSVGLNNYNWFAGNINYYFNKDISAGVKAGYSQSAMYFSGNVGLNILESDNWGLRSIFQLSTRFVENNSQNNTYQINLLFNIRYKIDFDDF